MGLDDFFCCLDGWDERVPLDVLLGLMAELNIREDELAAHIRFADAHYQRNPVRRGAWYQALILCWKRGQYSPAHDHAGSTCGVRVMCGTAKETFYALVPGDLVRPTGSQLLTPGQVTGSQDGDVHRVAAEAGDLITLHVYSPPLQGMRLYKVLGES
jgi:cysteine dioxygenase